jgi:hypothetical protein
MERYKPPTGIPIGEVFPCAEGEGEGVARTVERARLRFPSINYLRTGQHSRDQWIRPLLCESSSHTVNRFFALSKILSASLLKIAEENSSPGPLPFTAEAMVFLSGIPFISFDAP